MASFETLKSGAVRARVYVTIGEETKRRTKAFPSKAEAVEWAQKVESSNVVKTGNESVMTVEDLHRTHMLRAVGASTIEREEGHFKHLKKKFGAKFPMSVTESDVTSYTKSALKDRDWNTVRRELIYLKTLLSRLPSSPLQHLKIKGENLKPKRPITASDCKQLLAAIRPANHWIVRLMMESGWRRAEVWGLRPCDLRLEDCVADFPDAKTHDKRIRTYTEKCRQLLAGVIAEHRAKGRKDTDRLCRFSNPNGLSVMFIRAREKAGLGDHVHPHNLRHGFITRAQNTFGLTVSDVMMFTGHKDKKTVMRYTQPMVEVARAKMKGIWCIGVGMDEEES